VQGTIMAFVEATNIPVHGLWYTGSIGPTIPDQCRWSIGLPLDLSKKVCMGASFGTSDGVGAECFPYECPQLGRFVSMFGRTTDDVKFRQVSDGLSNTIMVGETIPRQWRHNSLWGNNFPLGSTHIPFNSLNEFDDMESSHLPI
jgi:hypothetical protein